tara:strand:+ start:341 stop:937 length:597 start_codon:yes stop_codon:yes gene_type:complete
MKKTFEISIPTDWSEVSIKKYIKYTSAIQDVTDEDEISRITISVMCDISFDILNHIKLKDLKVIQKNLQKLISKPVNKQIINKINIDGKMFGFHPKINDLTMGEYVDIETFAKDNDLASMMCVLYRPITKEQGNRYDIEPYHVDHINNKKHFEKLSINIANAIVVFFWNLGNQQLNHIHQYLKETKKNQQQVDMVGLQ